ncbi:MAG TPA: helix-hairpin-helix domain-containing protein [Caldithrix abyssi]|uniref:Helix-hairpin-helix domain-containing protein n=1 Tax=Caldithrix abyssi TaxID=187145 RepID=A0A7V1LPK2_CALAY|nr:helix-hairpin-helix domain-containing protein [Caldithrix abyssi]
MITLSKGEKKALLVFSSVMFIAYGIQWWQPHTVNINRFDYRLADSLYDVLAADTLKKVPPPRETKKKTARKKRIPAKRLPALKSININTATKSMLIRLPKIGPVTAENILNYRKENGAFRRMEDLLKVKRIGPKTLEKIKPYLFIADSLK